MMLFGDNGNNHSTRSGKPKVKPQKKSSITTALRQPNPSHPPSNISRSPPPPYSVLPPHAQPPTSSRATPPTRPSYRSTQNLPLKPSTPSPSVQTLHRSPHHIPLRPKTPQAQPSRESTPNLPLRSKTPKIPYVQENRGQSCMDLSKATTKPMHTAVNGLNSLQQRGNEYLHQEISICDLISSKFNAVITSIDGEVFSGDERELVVHQVPDPAIRGGWGFSNPSRAANNAISSAVTNPRSSNFFAKVNLYANSRLPPYLPPLKLYLPSYPLICLSAQYSERVYTKPVGREREALVDADWRLGTKAMVVKSIPMDDTIVFAIRGSQTFMDWAVNLQTAPVSPANFLDDPGNLCHAGFLSVARKMIRPVAARLRSLLEEDPSRTRCSLIMTGHSAGGAIASLIYSHMLSEVVQSELNILAGCFKRIHCITFGSPPISLLPLTKPNTLRCKKSLFLSFINEGDPVPRADKAYMRSLFDLYASPAPGSSCIGALLPSIAQPRFKLACSRPKAQKSHSAPVTSPPIWAVPPGSLSCAGRLVVLRTPVGRGEDDVRAEVTTDEQLRGVVFGDPMKHMMKTYARRVEILATRAVTAKIY